MLVGGLHRGPQLTTNLGDAIYHIMLTAASREEPFAMPMA